MMSEKTNKWLATHPCRNLCKLGLFETYIFLFDCSTIPLDFKKKYQASYELGRERILKIIKGEIKYERD